MHACFDLRVLALFPPCASPCRSFRTFFGRRVEMVMEDMHAIWMINKEKNEAKKGTEACVLMN